MLLSPTLTDLDYQSLVNWDDPLTHGLVFWHLNLPGRFGGTRAYDLVSGRLLTRTNMASPPTSTSGQGTTTLPGAWVEDRFDGTDDIIDADGPLLMPASSPLTILVYGAMRSYVAANRPTIMGRGFSVGVVGYVLGFNLVGTGPSEGLGRLTFITYSAGTGVVGSYSTQDFASDTTPHLWGGSWDGTQWSTWIDGREDRNAIGTQTTSPQASAAKLTISAEHQAGAYARFFPGSISSAYMYRRALSAPEHAQLYADVRTFHPRMLRPLEVPWGLVSVGAAGNPWYYYAMQRRRAA